MMRIKNDGVRKKNRNRKRRIKISEMERNIKRKKKLE